MGRISDEAHAGWHDFARRREVTVTAMEEVIGRWLREHDEAPDHIEKCIDQLVEEARRIDAEHRDRHPRG